MGRGHGISQSDAIGNTHGRRLRRIGAHLRSGAVRDVLLVAVGGAIGSALRFWLSDLIAHHTYREVGTGTVNLIGSLVLGVVVGWVSQRGPATGLQMLVGVGLLGGFTTFSTWMIQAAGLLEATRFAAAGLYLFGSIALGLFAASIGLLIGRALA